MTSEGYRVIRGHCDLLYDPKVSMTFVVGLTQFMTPRGHGLTKGQLDLLKKLTFFMTPKVTVIFVVCLT